MYAGIAKSQPAEAGWHIYCNGRLVLTADRSRITGWGDTIPRYHNQYAEFRCYVYLDRDDAGLLPWNTTKSGVDADSPLYRSIRLQMTNIMRPVIEFLNRLNEENDPTVDEKPLNIALNATYLIELAQITEPTSFLAPLASKIARTRTGRIQYSKPRDEIDRVKSSLEVDTLKEVGEMTFDYYYKLECEE